MRNARDIENYLERLKQVAPVIDMGIAEAKAPVAAGVVAPGFTLERALGGIDRFLAREPAKNAGGVNSAT